MKTILYKTINVLVIILIISGCYQEKANLPIFKPLSENQLEQFIRQQHIEPLDVEIVGEATAVLYQTPSEIGHYLVGANQEGKFSFSQGKGDNNSKVTPVSLGWVSTGTPFAQVIINDSKIREKADKIIIRFENGDEIKETVNRQTGFIIPDRKVTNQTVNLEWLKIFDSQGNLLFEWN